MQIYNWATLPEERLGPLLTRRFASGERSTIGRFALAKGCTVPVHCHDNEQLIMILSGALKLTIDGREVVLKTGDILVIPPNAAHGAEALEDTDEIDFFAPARRDWMDGTDAYLRKKKD